MIRATNVKRGKIEAEGMLFVDPESIPGERAIELQEDDIIVVRSGAYTGDSAIVTTKHVGALAGYDMVIRTNKKVFAPFLAWQLLSAPVLNAQIDLCRSRAAQPHLNAEELGGCLITLPPLEEQRAICKYLQHEMQRLDTLAQAMRESISLLLLRRAALIASAVRGQMPIPRG